MLRLGKRNSELPAASVAYGELALRVAQGDSDVSSQLSALSVAYGELALRVAQGDSAVSRRLPTADCRLPVAAAPI